MAKTRLSLVTALFLIAASSGLLLARRYLLSADIDGPGGAVWKITLAAAGELGPEEMSFNLTLPPDFRHQHIFDERFQSRELLHRVVPGKDPARREVAWRRSSVGGAQPFRLNYSFRCLTEMRRPTLAMKQLTDVVDAAPAEGVALRPAPRVESDHKEIFRLARTLAREDAAAADQVRAFFDHVARLDNEPTLGSRGALECLRSGGGDPGGKSRLLVALCRNRGIPARLVSGLILTGSREQGPHHWAEAWVNDHWLPMCPTYRVFGPRQFPRNYLVLQVGEDNLFRGPAAPVSSGFIVQALHDEAGGDGERPLAAAGRFGRKLSLYSLRPGEQHLVKFLLLLPLGALIVSAFRTLVGVPTFGTFGPALLGLAFLELKALPWGLTIFVLLVLSGWGVRRLLDRYHLLLVPRISVLLTLIILLLVLGIAAASHAGVAATQYVSLFPLVILTHMVERFWTVGAEDGTPASFKTLLGTLAVSAAVSLALSPEAVGNWLFRYPEGLGFVLAAQFLLGRYTGYRLSELYRFGDLLKEEQPPGEPGASATGGTNELADPLAASPGVGHPGDEPPQYGVHPGPQPAPALSPGGWEAEDAGPVPRDRCTHP